MEKYKLKNGATVIFEKTSSHSVAVEVMFKVGSNNETEKIAGISHFLEHMLFEGTKSRKDSREIANEIEKYGAEFNAYTTGDRTAYFIKIINKKFEKALDILSDMIINSVFDKKIMEKEKKVILKEINMVTDDPRQHQWILFQKSLFDTHPARNPTYGTVKAVKSISRASLINYFKNYYVSNNMIISITGNVDNVKSKVEKYFGNMLPGKVKSRRLVKEPVQKKSRKFVETRKIQNSYMVLGYRTVSRLSKDSYVFEVIHGILGRGQSGWMFNEIRNKRGLAYQVGISMEHEVDYGHFSVFVGLDKSKVQAAKSIILQQFDKLQTITDRELSEAKTYLEGYTTLQTEDNFQNSDNMAFWETIKDVKLFDDYIKEIKKVTIRDVKRVAKKFLNNKYTLVVIEQK